MEEKNTGLQDAAQSALDTAQDAARVFTQEAKTTVASHNDPVTVKQWLLFWLCSLINIIPFIGTIVYFILICVIAFKADLKVPPSLKTFCKAYLIVLAVGIILGIVFMGSFMGMLFSGFSQF